MKKITVDVATAVFNWFNEGKNTSPCWVSGFATSCFPAMKVTFNTKPTKYVECSKEVCDDGRPFLIEYLHFKDADGNESVIKNPHRCRSDVVRAFATESEAIEYYNRCVDDSSDRAKDEIDFYNVAVTDFIGEIRGHKIK